MKTRMTPILALSFIVLCSFSISAHAGKETICHWQANNGNWKAVSLNEKALPEHLSDHDDATPGGQTNFTATSLDENCEAVVTSCPCAFDVGYDQWSNAVGIYLSCNFDTSGNSIELYSESSDDYYLIAGSYDQPTGDTATCATFLGANQLECEGLNCSPSTIALSTEQLNACETDLIGYMQGLKAARTDVVFSYYQDDSACSFLHPVNGEACSNSNGAYFSFDSPADNVEYGCPVDGEYEMFCSGGTHWICANTAGG